MSEPKTTYIKDIKVKSKITEDDMRDLAVLCMDEFWYGYLGMEDEVEEYNFNLQDIIQDTIKIWLERINDKGDE